MLMPADRDDADPEKPVIGELVQQLVDDGKGYAQAEIALAKAKAYRKWDQADRPLAIVAAGFICGQAAVICIAVGLFSVLQEYIGPFGAGLVSAGIFGTGAFLLLKNGYTQLKDLF